MTLHTSLRSVLERALITALGAPLALSACGPAPIDPSLYSAPECNADKTGFSIESVIPSKPVDYIELRRLRFFQGDDGGITDWSTVSYKGIACDGASDKTACRDQLARINLTAGFAPLPGQLQGAFAVVTTSGNDVSEITTLEAWRAFLGTIDNAQEASLLAWAAGYQISCTDLQQGAVRKVSTGFEVIGMKGFACGAGTALRRFTVGVGADGVITELKNEIVKVGDSSCQVGRRPEGLQAAQAPHDTGALGRFFSEIAFLEAAAVHAFDRMERELRSFDAPEALLQLVARARRDEVRHAKLMTALATRHGGRAVTPQVDALPPRGLLEVAIENAVEGCIRETFGALVAKHQALAASDDRISRTMIGIAHDETRHAELSWQVHAFLMPKLTEAEHAQVAQAQREAIAQLKRELEQPVASELVTRAGVPQPSTALALCAQLEKTLWA